MSEGTTNDIPPSTPANPEGFKPLDLPADLRGKVVMGPPPAESPVKGFTPLDIHPRPGLPPQEEVGSLADMQFESAYIALQKSVERGDADGYVTELGKLTELMRTEIKEDHAPPKFGDLHHTFMEWHRQSSYVVGSDAEQIKSGKDVETLSNTLENHNWPHRDWPGDGTMATNSKSFGGAVAGYVNSRGNKFIAASVIPGLSDRNSEFMVQTILKGFPKATAAK